MTSQLPDHYITVSYSIFLITGGVIGYLQKGSTVSLAMGVGCGLLLALYAFMYAVEYSQTPQISRSLTLVPLGVSGAVGVVMVSRFVSSGKFMPAGMVALLSLLTCLYYTLRLSGVLQRPKRRRRGRD